jgi:hypothetical protein
MIHTQTYGQVTKEFSKAAELTLGATGLSQSSGTQDLAFPSLKVKIIGARKKWRSSTKDYIIII